MLEERKIRKYYVDDIVPSNKSNIKYVFVFESPHNTEIDTRIPVSGSTGQYILKKLQLEGKGNNSFGEFVKKRCDTTAILNVSNYPLQRVDSDTRSEDCLKKIERVRRSYKTLLDHKKQVRKVKTKASVHVYAPSFTRRMGKTR